MLYLCLMVCLLSCMLHQSIIINIIEKNMFVNISHHPLSYIFIKKNYLNIIIINNANKIKVNIKYADGNLVIVICKIYTLIIILSIFLVYVKSWKGLMKRIYIITLPFLYLKLDIQKPYDNLILLHL